MPRFRPRMGRLARPTPLLASLLGLALAACSGPGDTDAPAAASPAPPKPRPRLVAATPCELLTGEELRKVFTEAAAIRQENHEAFGITSCEWNGDFGRLLVQQWPSKGHTPREEVLDLVAGFTQGGADAPIQVRLVPVSGMGHFATAVVERRDPARGVLADMAVLSIARDGKTLVFLTDGLDTLERDEALKRLTRLGRFAYKRL